MRREALPALITSATWGLLLLFSACSLFEKSDSDSMDDFPAWSPDGRTVAFVRYGGQSSADGLYLISADGGNPRLVLAGEWATTCWSPDGRWLVFSVAYGGRMYKVKTNGDSLTALTDSSDRECFHPDWSEKAGLIAFDSQKDDPKGTSVLWLMRPDGSHKRDISQHGVGEWRMPSWSPDGSRIVFARWYLGGPDEPDLAIVDSCGKNEVRLTSDTAWDEAPAWSPDGKSIAFCRSESRLGTSTYRICVLNLEDGSRRYVTEGGAFEPTWSPDSKRICYSYHQIVVAGDPEVVRGKLWVIDDNGSNARQLTH